MFMHAANRSSNNARAIRRAPRAEPHVTSTTILSVIFLFALRLYLCLSHTRESSLPPACSPRYNTRS